MTIELVPSTCWGRNVRSAVSRKTWDGIRRSIYMEYDTACGVCGKRQVKLHCHEVWDYDIDDQGEYVFRQIAQFTQGRFVFLTYAGPANGGSPGDETTHHVEDYSVLSLDDLVVKIVEDTLAPLAG